MTTEDRTESLIMYSYGHAPLFLGVLGSVLVTVSLLLHFLLLPVLAFTCTTPSTNA